MKNKEIISLLKAKKYMLEKTKYIKKPLVRNLNNKNNIDENFRRGKFRQYRRNK